MVLFIDNSSCSIQGLELPLLRKLREKLSFSEMTGRMITVKGGKRIRERQTFYLMDRYGNFPTGLLYLVEEFLADECPDRAVEYNDVRRIPTGSREVHLMLTRSFEPYPEQMEAAQAAFDQGRGIISAPTGTGKSAILAEIIAKFRLRTLVVVPSLGLKRQLTDSLRAGFGRRKVGPLSKRPDIAVENVDALDVNDNLADYDLVIIDEFHHAAAETYRKLNDKLFAKIYYKIGLTATPWRANTSEKLLLESVLSKLIYQISYETAVGKGYIVPMEAFYIDIPPPPVKEDPSGKMKKAKDRDSWHAVYKNHIVERPDRNAIIANLLNNCEASGLSTLVLTKQVAHGKAIQALTGVPFAEGANDCNADLLAAFNARERHGLIGTVGVLGEGVDSKPAEYVILAGGGKSKVQFFQNIGRGFRKYPGKESCKIILLRDSSHPWLLKHFNTCVDYLREEFGCEPAKLDF